MPIKLYSTPCFMCKDQITERTSTPILPETNSSISLLQDLNVLRETFQPAQNTVTLCANCHDEFINPIDPGLISYPSNLDFFIQFELYIRSQEKRVQLNPGQALLKQRVPSAGQYASYITAHPAAVCTGVSA
ncbi:hypothetical protein BDW74DRAFT_152714 [Aspergillus multicolor]|uniref:uncharacterized protein n=1 Tax=Aspergillus multicolor TaxID=41759 RepID=UPI003CCE3682